MAAVQTNYSASAVQDSRSGYSYTCNTCQVAFRNSDLQKTHLKSDWHRYNLKRRVASLPPIASELFAEKVLQSRASTAAQADRANFERLCQACQKTYYSENSYRNHISSRKHKEREAQAAARPSTAGKNNNGNNDAASTVMSSTFSLGDPQQRASRVGIVGEGSIISDLVDPAAEEEFTHVVEGFKKASLDDGNSVDGKNKETQAQEQLPYKRPANPRLSAAGQFRSDHPLSRVNTDSQNHIEDNADNMSTVSSVATATATDATTVPAAEPEPSIKLCLFCNYASPSMDLNVAHMERFHSLFIPEKQYLQNLEGLLEFLQERVRQEYACIYCDHQKRGVYAIQAHMRDKSHCKIPYETEAEKLDIGEFYDFRSTYSDSEEDDEDETEGEGRGGSRGEDDDGWETDSAASSLDSADLTAVPADPVLAEHERLERHPSQTHHKSDGWHAHAGAAAYYDDYELHLPSGRAVGHRSLKRYFRQNLHNYPSQTERDKMQRLAIMNGEMIEVEDEEDGFEDEDDDDDVDGGNGAPLGGDNNQERALTQRQQTVAAARAALVKRPTRNALGLAGVSDKTKAELQTSERRANRAVQATRDRAQLQSSAKKIGKNFQFLGRT